MAHMLSLSGFDQSRLWLVKCFMEGRKRISLMEVGCYFEEEIRTLICIDILLQVTSFILRLLGHL